MKFKVEMLSNAFVFARFLFGLWAIICLAWTFHAVSEAHWLEHGENVAAYKESCLEGKGILRHESASLGVNLYCQEPNGNETMFINHSELSFYYTMSMFFERLSFGVLGAR